MATATQVMHHEKVRSRRQHHRKVSGFILIGCIALAVLTVLFVPLLLGGAAAPASATVPEAAPVEMQVVQVENLAQAGSQLGFDATLPATLPDEYALTAVNVVDGSVLELEYAAKGKPTVFYRTAPGSDDLTWDETEYAFTVTEEEGGVTRSYAGVAEQKLSLALWADGDYSYALVAPDGAPAEDLHLMAESIG